MRDKMTFCICLDELFEELEYHLQKMASIHIMYPCIAGKLAKNGENLSENVELGNLINDLMSHSDSVDIIKNRIAELNNSKVNVMVKSVDVVNSQITNIINIWILLLLKYEYMKNRWKVDLIKCQRLFEELKNVLSSCIDLYNDVHDGKLYTWKEAFEKVRLACENV